jgi:TolA-binding protein
VRAEARHQLKEDRFNKVTIQAAEDAVHWSVEHKTTLMVAAVIVLALGVAGFFAWYALNEQDKKASLDLSQAVRIMDTQLRPANMPAEPENPSFASAKERATEAHKKLNEIVDQYPHTRSAEFARYFLGTTANDMGDEAGAARQFQKVADSHNSNLAALAKVALASLYRSQHEDKKAIDIYKDLISKPAETVSKTTAQIGLAETYEADGQPAEAKRIYQQVQKDNPTGAAAQLAQEKMQAIK